jgi:hypothetical protein
MNDTTDRSGLPEFGNTRVSIADPRVPAATFKLSERIREIADRIDRGDLGEVESGVALLMRGRTLVTIPLRARDPDLREMAAALISAIDARKEIFR